MNVKLESKWKTKRRLEKLKEDWKESFRLSVFFHFLVFSHDYYCSWKKKKLKDDFFCSLFLNFETLSSKLWKVKLLPFNLWYKKSFQSWKEEIRRKNGKKRRRNKKKSNIGWNFNKIILYQCEYLSLQESRMLKQRRERLKVDQL